MRRRRSPVCDRDCFNCQHDDCICDDMTASDYASARELEEYINPKSRRERAIAAYQREYYEANREALAAKQREYYEANREAIAAKKREYYEANREAIAAYQREYRKANRESIAAKQREYYEANRESIAAKQREYREANREAHASAGRTLRMARKAMGYSQMALAQIVGVTQPLISQYECGKIPFSDDLFRDVLPALKEDITQ